MSSIRAATGREAYPSGGAAHIHTAGDLPTRWFPCQVLEVSVSSEQARAQAFVDCLGFDTTQALMLAATRDEGEYVDLALVRRLLECRLLRTISRCASSSDRPIRTTGRRL